MGRDIEWTPAAWQALTGIAPYSRHDPGHVPVTISIPLPPHSPLLKPPPIGLPSDAGGGQVGFGTGGWGLGAVQVLDAAWASARMNGNEAGWLAAHPDINPGQGAGYQGTSGGGLPVP